MDLAKQVVWKEGIFISPQHFQQQAIHNKSYIQNYASTQGYTDHFGLSSIALNKKI